MAVTGLRSAQRWSKFTKSCAATRRPSISRVTRPISGLSVSRPPGRDLGAGTTTSSARAVIRIRISLSGTSGYVASLRRVACSRGVRPIAASNSDGWNLVRGGCHITTCSCLMCTGFTKDTRNAQYFMKQVPFARRLHRVFRRDRFAWTLSACPGVRTQCDPFERCCGVLPAQDRNL